VSQRGLILAITFNNQRKFVLLQRVITQKLSTYTSSATTTKQKTTKHSKPENNDEAVKEVVNGANVSKRTFSNNLQCHFDNEQTAEEQVAVFQHLRKSQRLQTNSSLSIK